MLALKSLGLRVHGKPYLPKSPKLKLFNRVLQSWNPIVGIQPTRAVVLEEREPGDLALPEPPRGRIPEPDVARYFNQRTERIEHNLVVDTTFPISLIHPARENRALA